MRNRLLALIASAAACIGTAFVVLPDAQASPVPPLGTEWADCTVPGQNYCVVSRSRNGGPIPPSGTGERWYPWVDRLDAGTVRYGVTHDVTGTGNPLEADVPPGDTYAMTVRTGTIRPRELYGEIRNVDFSIGTDSTGWTFTISFQPTPLHHVGYDDADGAGPDPRTCTVAACGDDTWAASLNYDGFVTGYVTDLASSGLSASEIGWRTGMVRAYNAQDENTYYDFDTGSLVIQLANPHLIGPRTSPGAPATGSYEAFLPNAYLTNVMNVPDPSMLTGGSFVVTRGSLSSPTYVSFTLAHEPGGIRITIPGITYSRPTYRIKPRPTAPGKPRAVSAKKISAHSARVRFAKPLATGGRRIDWYQAACHRAGGKWHFARRSAAPITVSSLPKGRVWCKVRAHNAKGYGKWSALDRS